MIQRRHFTSALLGLLLIGTLLLNACGAAPPGDLAPTAAAVPEPSAAAVPPPPTLVPTGEPAAPSAPAAVAVLWPDPLPSGLVVAAEQSTADERGFQLALIDPASAQNQVGISGGAAARRPPLPASRPIRVRGQDGLAASTGAGYAVWWEEQGQPYAVSGFALSAEAAVAIAETLAPISLADWRARLAAPVPTPAPSSVATQQCPAVLHLKGDVDMAFEPFCVAWIDRVDGERGFRIDLAYGGGESFSYTADADATQLILPADDAPRAAESRELCQRRGSFTLSVTALLPAGEELVGGVGLDSECLMGFPPEPAPEPTPEPTLEPTPEPSPGASAVDPNFAALQRELAERMAGWAGLHAISVVDIQTGQQIGVNADRPQLAACTIKLGIMLAVAQDIEAGTYAEADVAELVQSAMGPSETWPARELLRIVGGGDIGAGVHRVNAIMAELGATGSILTHPPGYPDEEYGYLASLGIDENRLTAADLTMLLGQLYRGEALGPSGTEYVLRSLTIAPDWMDRPLRAALPEGVEVYHKIGQLYAPESTWNDAGIVVFERGGQRYAYAIAYLGSYGASWQDAYAHETELAAVVWAHFAATYPS